MNKRLRSGSSPVSEPIKSTRRSGFAIGWLAIVAVCAAGFLISIKPLDHSRTDVRTAQMQMDTAPRS